LISIKIKGKEITIQTERMKPTYIAKEYSSYEPLTSRIPMTYSWKKKFVFFANTHRNSVSGNSQRLICLFGSMETRVVMQERQWQVLEHPPYSPDHAPSYFHLFCPLKHHISAENFPDDEVLEREVTAWYRQQPNHFMLLVFRGL
jgi:hypothetical protein